MDLPTKNTLTGYVEQTHVSEALFEEQRRKFQSASLINRPNAPLSIEGPNPIAQNDLTDANPGTSNVSLVINKNKKKRKRLKNDDPLDIDNYMGPWAKYEGEQHVSKPSAEDAAILSEYLSKKKKHNVKVDESKDPEAIGHEKAQLHIKDPYDYQGRSFLVAPRDLDEVNLHSDTPPSGCRIPRNLAHTYRGHSKAITSIRYFPKTAHLLLSASLDNKVKLWEVYKERRCVMTFAGHKQGVRDIAFNNGGDRFVSASYDKYIKLWDSETGQCVQRFTNGKIPFCVKFNPDPECAHLFLAGMSNNKVICWDCRSGESVQEYDRHLGPINSINFVDENRKFITTSDDKTIRVWEWDIPVDVKYIADPTLHSIPAVTMGPNGKRMLCQSMDNKIQGFTCHNKFKLDRDKIFSGHMVAGYSCSPDFSCDMSMVVSGDADGKMFFWSWSSTKVITVFKAHDGACLNVLWHPHERQKLISSGQDSLIKIWN